MSDEKLANHEVEKMVVKLPEKNKTNAYDYAEAKRKCNPLRNERYFISLLVGVDTFT